MFTFSLITGVVVVVSLVTLSLVEAACASTVVVSVGAWLSLVVAEAVSLTFSELANSGGYGSENMIIALYDAEIRGQDSLVYGMDLLNALKLKNEDEWEFVTQDYNIISPMTVDLIDNIIGRRLFWVHGKVTKVMITT